MKGICLSFKNPLYIYRRICNKRIFLQFEVMTTAPGKYTIGFGANVEDIRVTAPYNLSKQYTVKCHDVMKPNM